MAGIAELCYAVMSVSMSRASMYSADSSSALLAQSLVWKLARGDSVLVVYDVPSFLGANTIEYGRA